MAVAIVVATAGVVVMSLKPGADAGARQADRCSASSAGAMFGLSAIGYRGAILSLGDPSFVMAATCTLTIGLAVQAAGADALSVRCATAPC